MPSDDPADLRAVRGIGPKAAVRLKEAGVADLATLARTPINELASALAGLPGKFSADRIAREGWITQAAGLAAASRSAPDPAERDTGQPIRHSFTVEVRLPRAGREVVSTRITHVPTGDEEAWGGWDPERLAGFVQDRSGLAPAPPAGSAPAPEARAQAAPREPSADSGPEPKFSPVPEPQPAPAPGLDRLHAYAVVPASGPGFAGGPGHAVTATLTVGPARLGLTGSGPASVQAEVLARQLLTGGTVVVGRGSVVVDPAEPVRLEVPCDLSAARRPLVLCAMVRVLASSGRERPRVQELTGARLLIT